MVVGIIIGFLGHEMIIHGVKTIANTSTGKKVQTYIVNSTVGILYNKITNFIKNKKNQIEYKDNNKIYLYIFNLDDHTIININKNVKSTIIFNFYYNFMIKIKSILDDNSRKISVDKNIIKLKNMELNNIINKTNIFNDINTNNFLKYLIKTSFPDFKILLYINRQNMIYIKFEIWKNEKKSVVRKFTYNQLKENFYKITLCLLDNKKNIFDNIHYNNIISFYYLYFNEGISKNFILIKEFGELKTYHLIESEDMDISKDYNPYREDGIMIGLKKFTSTFYTNMVKKYKKNNNEYSKKLSEKVLNQIKNAGDSHMSFMDSLFKSKSGGGGIIELTSLENNRIEFLKYILYDFKGQNNFQMKYNFINKSNNKSNNKLFALILTYDIIKTHSEIGTIPSIRINFLNQINKNVEDIDIELHKEKELLNYVSSTNFKNNNLGPHMSSGRQDEQMNNNNNNNNTQNLNNKQNINNTYNVNQNLFNNIRDDINQSFINEIIENFDLNNILESINFNIDMYEIISKKRNSYNKLNNNEKIEADIKIRSDFVGKNKDYDYNICINLNNLNNVNNLIYKYKLNINYSINEKNKQLHIEKKIKKYCEKCIKNLNINFKLYLLKNNDLNIFFVNLINEGCNIDFVINKDNIYIIINKNDKVVILDCFSVYSLFSFSKNFDQFYYKISNPAFIYHIRDQNIFLDKKNYTFDKLFNEYNNSYCSISDSMKKLGLDELFINFEDGLINFIATKKTFLNKIKKILYNDSKKTNPHEITMIESIFYNFNKYNRNFYNFFINHPEIMTKLIYKDNLLYIKIINNNKKSLIELNLFKNLFIDHNFKLTDLYETINNLTQKPQQINCKYGKCPFYTKDDIKEIKNNIFNFDIGMIIIDGIDILNNKNRNNSSTINSRSLNSRSLNSNTSNNGTSNSRSSNNGTSNSRSSNSRSLNSNTSNNGTSNNGTLNSITSNNGTLNSITSNNGTSNNDSLNSITSNNGTFNNSKSNNSTINTNTNMTSNNSINIDKNLVKNIINSIYDNINDTLKKYVNLRVEDDKIKIYNPQTGIKNTELITQFSKLDKLNTYLILLYKNNINKNIKEYRLKVECKILYLEIIYKSRATFGGKNPSLLIDLKKFILKIIDTQKYNKLTANKNYFTTLKSFIKTDMSKNNLGKRKNNYQINNKCIT